jgi:hypothetical protein
LAERLVESELKSSSLSPSTQYSVYTVYKCCAVVYCQVKVLCWNKGCLMSPRVSYYLSPWKPSRQYKLKLIKCRTLHSYQRHEVACRINKLNIIKRCMARSKYFNNNNTSRLVTEFSDALSHRLFCTITLGSKLA